jgi:hypothetical protein
MIPAHAGIAVGRIHAAMPVAHVILCCVHASRSSTISPPRTTMLHGLKPIQ